MRNIIGLGIVGIGLIIAWNIGSRLSADALAFAVGVLFGVLAGVPSALFALAMDSGRRYPMPPMPPVPSVPRDRRVGVVERQVDVWLFGDE